MTEDQLQKARAAQWHQNASPLLTLDDAKTWLDQQGLCLFLPRHAQLPSPAPSFVEACFGQTTAMPPRAAIDSATELMARLVKERHAVPLNLLGTFSEQPDFLATPETLPWIASIRGERDWKSAPAGRTSPLLVDTWKLLEKKGALDAVEIRSALGRELTEAAVLRALVELWSGLRVVPTYEPGGASVWNLLKADYPKQLAAGANTSQVTALSALISFYLQSAVAASGEEIEVFLSPLTARSRIREVVHGLTATRQLDTVSLGTQTLLHVAGGLPELAAPAVSETETPAASESEVVPTESRPQRTAFDRRPPRPARKEEQEERTAFRRPAADRGGRPANRSGDREGGRPNFRSGPKRFAAGGREGRPDTPRPDRPRREGSAGGFERPSYGKRPFSPRPRGEGQEQERPPFRKSFDKPRSPREGSEERRPFAGKKPFAARPGKPASGFAGKSGSKFGPKFSSTPGGRAGSRPAGGFGGRTGADRPRREASGGSFKRPSFGKRFDGARPPRQDGENKPFGEKKPFTPRAGKFAGKPGARPYPPRGESRGAKPGEGGNRPPFRRPASSGEERPPREASGGGFKRPPFGKRFSGPRPPREGGESGERKPFSRPGSGFGGKPKSFGDKSGKPGDKSGKPRFDRPKTGAPSRSAEGGVRPAGRPPARFSKSGPGSRSGSVPGSGFKPRPGGRPGGRPAGGGGFGKKKFSPGGKPFPKSGPRKSGPRKPRREDSSE